MGVLAIPQPRTWNISCIYVPFTLFFSCWMINSLLHAKDVTEQQVPYDPRTRVQLCSKCELECWWTDKEPYHIRPFVRVLSWQAHSNLLGGYWFSGYNVLQGWSRWSGNIETSHVDSRVVFYIPCMFSKFSYNIHRKQSWGDQEQVAKDRVDNFRQVLLLLPLHLEPIDTGLDRGNRWWGMLPRRSRHWSQRGSIAEAQTAIVSAGTALCLQDDLRRHHLARCPPRNAPPRLRAQPSFDVATSQSCIALISVKSTVTWRNMIGWDLKSSERRAPCAWRQGIICPSRERNHRAATSSNFATYSEVSSLLTRHLSSTRLHT